MPTTRVLCAALLLAVLAAPAARAHGGITEFSGRPARDSVARAAAAGGPAVAAATSIGATLLPVLGGGLLLGATWDNADPTPAYIGAAIATAGVVAGPWTGYAVGGIGRRGASGVLLRAGLLALLLPLSGASQPDGYAGFLACALAASDAWDVAQVARQVARHGPAAGRAGTVDLRPCVTAHGRAPGLALRMRFGGAER